jgi:glycosyltransferase involved in cell wall biosynthesis
MAEASAQDRPAVSACIITRDEADRLPECLASLGWCDEILVIDSHSRDRTREVAAGAGARVIARDWPGHVAQKEFAVRAARHDWVFCIDADERVSKELAEEIEEHRRGGFGSAAGYSVPRLSSYLGRWIRHGTWYPDRKLRLFDRRRGGWGGRDPHDRVEVDGKVEALRGELLHYPYRSLDDHLATIDRYTTITARELHAEGRRATLLDVAIRPPLRFLGFYFLRLGLLDGWRGLLLASLAAHYVRLRYWKLWLMARGAAKRPAG